MNEINAMLRSENAADRFIETFGNTKNYDILNDLSVNDLQKLNKMVVSILKERKNKIGQSKKANINIGDIVEVNHKDFSGEIFEVKKLNPKKAQLERENGEIWNIPYSMILN